jgi:hypothetical protein
MDESARDSGGARLAHFLFYLFTQLGYTVVIQANVVPTTLFHRIRQLLVLFSVLDGT